MWRRSTRCVDDENCLEVLDLENGGASIRDSKRGEDSPILTVPPQAWGAFIAALKNIKI